MTLQRRTLNLLLAGAVALAVAPGAYAQAGKTSVVLGMTLEPSPGLDPTTAAAAAIGEVVHYNILEGLTKINVDGTVTPLLAESWEVSPDGKSYTFKLKKGIKFQDGEPFDSAAVKFSFERARAEGSTNKAKKAVFDNLSSIATPDAHTVILVLNNPDGAIPFRMGENTAVILSPRSAAQTATNPVGTDHTVTAFAQAANNAPVPGVTINFRVMSGPNSGKTGVGTTGADGKTSWTYHDDGGAGTDTIQAFIGTTLSSNQVLKIWGLACDVNNDGKISPADLTLIRARNNTVATGPTDPYDPNRDGVVNVADWQYCRTRLTSTTP